MAEGGAAAGTERETMQILLTNDDGVGAPALWALRGRLAELGRVTVVAPRCEQSGVSHAITYLSAISAEGVRGPGGGEAYAVSGTPADCVKFALHQILPSRPDLVVSGINMGLNLGCNVFYSGTVAAAVEGAINGILSFAFSACPSNSPERAADEALRVLRLLLGLAHAGGDGALAFNVNIPELAAGEPPVVFTHHRDEPSPERYVPRPAGERNGYQLTGVTAGGFAEARDSSDVHVVGQGMISVTPLRTSLTHVEALRALRTMRLPQR